MEELCERYLKTILHQKPKTIEAKKNVVNQMGVKGGWPEFKTRQVKDVKPSVLAADWSPPTHLLEGQIVSLGFLMSVFVCRKTRLKTS